MTTTTLSYQGSRIRLHGAMLNLIDMWQAADLMFLTISAQDLLLVTRP